MTDVKVENILDVPIDSAWAVLADFGGFLNWAGGEGATAEIIGDGIGMVRDMDLPGLGNIAEKLTVLDHETRTLGYELVKGTPVGMGSYGCRVNLTEAGDGQCQINWHGMFEPVEGTPTDQVAEGLKGSYEGMSSALEAFVKANG